ncbi:hypothetical protein T4A_65 [Trichinella pseudospiralis]|uniref:Uncharacterized protein n=1 Tax=Trichinella pseudospiralis TaxID=6337 RepID=A0A0V1ES50_TRIPS|nr:hypothetical protein T4A_65 [Trichinella pseudospiralis]
MVNNTINAQLRKITISQPVNCEGGMCMARIIKKYEVLFYNGCKFKGMNIFITLFAFIAIVQQFSVNSNEFSNNGRRIHFQNYFQRMQKRLDPQYFQLGFGKRFMIENVNKIIANFKEPNGYSYKVAYFDGLLMITFHLIVLLV